MKDKKYCKVRDHCYFTGEYRGAAYRICNLKYSASKDIPIVYHNRSNYGFYHNRSNHFFIKLLAEEFEKQFTLLENADIYITFAVLVEK